MSVSTSAFPTSPNPGALAVVVIPTYNEAANIDTVLRRVLALEGEWAALIVDDGSPDGTAHIVRRYQEEYPGRIGLIEREGKQGLGTAYLAGFRGALDAGFELICEMDADLSHNPDDLARLAAACNGPEAADLAVGSRYVGGVRVVDWPLSRLVLSYAAGIYTRAITRLPIQDVTAGFACFRREVLEAIDFSRVRSNGYSFQIEMKYRAWKRGFRLREVPIIFTERTEGQSKMSGAIVREAVGKVWQLRLAHLTGRL
ncbi:MAG TPA: polyprenol monophosphomannose synthase [Bacteroidetes bacterium]|nr:polyprenol monophosphomannose synthase [Bacteroidota bacterium]